MAGIVPQPSRAELSEKRSEFSRTFRNPDGSLTTEIGQQQLHYRDASGRMMPIDSKLKSDASGYKVEANSLKVRFGTSPTRLVTLASAADPSATVTYGPLDAEAELMPTTKAGESSLSYRSYRRGADLAYEVSAGRLKEEIVLASPTEDTTFTFALTAQNLEPSPQRDGSVALVDKKGRHLIRIEKPYMTDAAAKEGGPDERFTSWDVTMTIDSSSTGHHILTIAADPGWLNDSNRSWPVVIDPTFSIVTTSTQDTYLRSDDPYDDYHFHTVGAVQVGGFSAAKQIRGLMQFDLSSIPVGAQITTATLGLTTQPFPYSTINVGDDYEGIATTTVHRVTTSWVESTATWNNMASNYNPTVQASSASDSPTFDLTALVESWHEDTYPNYGVMLLNNGQVKLLDDAVPGGSVNKTWTWNTSTVHSGAKSHYEPSGSGLHEHFYYDGPDFYIPTGSSLRGWVWRNSSVREIMLSYRVGTNWNYRAYWGSDLIARSGRHYIGALPAYGSWQALTCDASTLGLEAATINGAAFSLYDGAAYFDEVIGWRTARYYSRDAAVSEDQKPILSVTYWLPQLGLEKHKTYEQLGDVRVDLHSGNILYAHEDLSIPGRGVETRVSHFYNSLADTDSPYGYGWSLEPVMKLAEDARGNVCVTDGDGSAHYYAKNGSAYNHPPGIYKTLEKTGSTFRLTDIHDHVQYDFDSAGRLRTATDSHGNTSGYTFTDSKLRSITDPSGRQVQFLYGANGKLSKMTWGTEVWQDQQNQNIAFSTPELTDLWGAWQSFSLGATTTVTNVGLYLSTTMTGIDDLYVSIREIPDGTRLSEGTVPCSGLFEGTRTVDVPDVELGPGTYGIQLVGCLGWRAHYSDANPYVHGSLSTKPCIGSWSEITNADLYFALLTSPTNTEASFAYDANGRLTSITNAESETVSFTYRQDNGRLSTITKPMGGCTSLSYNANNQVSAVDLPDTVLTDCWYFSYGSGLHNESDSTSVTNGRGYTTSYEFNSAGLATKITDPIGATADPETPEADFPNDEAVEASATATYDNWYSSMLSEGKLSAGEQAVSTRTPVTDGRDRTFEYDANYNVIRETDKDGRSSTYTYDSNGNLDRETDKAGQVTDHDYDSQNNEIRVTSPNQGVSEKGYDQATNDLLWETDAKTNKTTYHYDTYGNCDWTVPPRGNEATANPEQFKTKNYYDVAGNYLVREEGPVVHNSDGTTAQAVSIATFDCLGNRLTSTDASGNVTYFGYDSVGRLVQTRQPVNVEGSSTVTYLKDTKAYDDNGNVVREEQIDEASQEVKTRTDYQFDSSDRQTAKKVWADVSNEASCAVTGLEYDACGNVVTETNPLGGATTSVYDALNRAVKRIEPDGAFIAYKYNAADNEVKEGSAAGTVVKLYGPSGALLATANELGYTQKFTADGEDNQTSRADATDQTTSMEYDENGNLVLITEPTATAAETSGTQTAYAYDADDNEESTTYNAQDPEAATHTSTTYNEEDELLEETDQRLNTDASNYDSFGGLVNKHNANLTGFITQYNSASMPATVSPVGTDTAASPVVSLAYDAVGNVIYSEVRDSQSGAIEASSSISYDDASRPTAVTAALGVEATLAYDGAGNVTRISDSKTGSSAAIHAEYDSASKLETLTCDDVQTTIGYDSTGRRESIYSLDGSLTTDIRYNAASEATSVLNSFSGVPVSSHAYSYDGKGNVIAVAELDGTASYRYDALDRLTEVTNKDASTVSYSYDRLGNRLSRVSSTEGTTTYEYNAANELVRQIRPDLEEITYLHDESGNLRTVMTDSGTTTYRYDNSHRLVSATTPTSTVEFVYDAEGKRVRKTVDGVARHYVYDGEGNVLLELGADGAVLVKYVRDDEGRALAMIQGSNEYYFAYNARGDVVALIDSAGETVGGYEYDEFGATREESGTIYNPLRFSGGNNAYWDSEIGLYWVESRYYFPCTGRWLTRDAVKGSEYVPAALHKYTYCADNPVSLTDPDGHAYVNFNGRKAWLKWNNGRTVKYSPIAFTQAPSAGWSREYGPTPPGDYLVWDRQDRRKPQPEKEYRYWGYKPNWGNYSVGPFHYVAYSGHTWLRNYRRNGLFVHGGNRYKKGQFRWTGGCIRVDNPFIGYLYVNFPGYTIPGVRYQGARMRGIKVRVRYGPNFTLGSKSGRGNAGWYVRGKGFRRYHE